MGFVFQDFSLLSNLTTLENISLQAEYAGWPRLVARDAGLESLGLVGLEGRISHRPLELSGGEQQRVAIARALVTKPSLLLADEPTGNLDTRNTEDVLDLLLRCNRDLGQTTVLVTHDIRVSKACNRLLMMQDGMIMDG